MIKKFISIKNIGKLTDYSANGDVELKKINVIYGENGSGKTTLCAILRSLKTGQSDYIIGRKTIHLTESPQAELRLENNNAKFFNNTWNQLLPEIEIFDPVFISENICAGYYVHHQHKKNLHIFAVGEEGVRLANEIVSLDSQIRELNEKIRLQERTIQELIIDRFSFDDFLKLPKDNDIAKKIAEQKHLLKTLEQADTIKKKSLLYKIELPEASLNVIKELLVKNIETISKEAETQIREHIKSCLDHNGERWIEYGLNHIKDNKCPFCGLNLEGVELIRIYQQYFSQAYKDFKTEIQHKTNEEKKKFSNDLLLQIQKVIGENGSLIEFWNQHVSSDINLPQINFAEIKNSWESLSARILNFLELKLNSPLERIVPDDDLLSKEESFKEVVTKINQYNICINQINEFIKRKKESVVISNLFEEQQKLAKLGNQQKRYTSDAVSKCNEYETLKRRKEELEIQKGKTKDSLDKLTAESLKKYQLNINKYLERFGADFRIVDKQTRYTGGRPSIEYKIEINSKQISIGDIDTPDSQPSFKNILSEGDKSTLAFAFFMARLEQDASLTSKIIVFDDPINSLDIHRRNTTVQNIIRKSQNSKQVILLTHDPVFARQIWQESDKALVKCLCIKREGKGSVIKEWDIEKETAGEYFQNYSILEKFLENGSGDLRHVACCIRPLIEGNLRIRFPGVFKENEWLGDFISKIRSADGNNQLVMIKQYLEEVEDINNYSKQYHHSQNPNADNATINSTELKAYVERTLNLLGIYIKQ